MRHALLDGGPAGRLLDLVLPPRCCVCDTVADGLCARCARALPPAPAGPPPDGVDRCAALMAHTGDGRRPALLLKRHAPRHTVALLGAAMATLVDGRPDAVTWAPTTAARQRRRGHDQAEVLADAVAESLGVPCARLLVRADRAAQRGRGRAVRLAGPCTEPVAPAPPHVLVVDDVRTTGATLTAAARALRRAGAVTVDAVTVSARP